MALNDIALALWLDARTSADSWEAMAATMPSGEPPFEYAAGLEPAAGALVVDPDGRVWCVAPTGGFGGHEFTLAKGRLDGCTPAATALIEVFEEVGLRVRLRAFLCDARRTHTFTRFYVADRIGGLQADPTWESQAVVLALLLALRGC